VRKTIAVPRKAPTPVMNVAKHMSAVGKELRVEGEGNFADRIDALARALRVEGEGNFADRIDALARADEHLNKMALAGVTDNELTLGILQLAITDAYAYRVMRRVFITSSFAEEDKFGERIRSILVSLTNGDIDGKAE
jgi:hypothetical protein